jgi:hypothetical protein
MKRKLVIGTAGICLLTLFGGAAAAEEHEYPWPPPEEPEVEGEVIERPIVEEAQRRPDVQAREGLPVTGGDAFALVGVGAAAIAVGGVLVQRSRRAEA